MALDFFRTMQPESGLVRELAVLPPNGDSHLLWSVAADIGQQAYSGERLADDDYPLSLVGACGARRADAFVRACGEAVERSALLPARPLDDDPAAPMLRAPTLWRSGGAAHCTTYAAADLATAARVRVPAACVDYPVPDRDLLTRFDPSPSGAAAGPSRAAAVDAALREILERDAAMIAWARQTRLPTLDPVAIANGTDRVAAQGMTRLLVAVERVGLTSVAGIAPTSVPGADCVIAVVLDADAQIAAAGLAVCDTTAAAAVKALQEALQVRTVLLGVAERYRDTPPPATVHSDLDRARLWARPEAMAAMERWTGAFGPPADPASLARDADAARLDWAAAVPGAVVVDLTPRLPDPIRALGWHAVKVLAPRHQALRMSEYHDWTWNPRRLEMPERQWKLACAVADCKVADHPHPFI